MLNTSPESLQEHVDNLDYNMWNTDLHPLFKFIVKGDAFTAIQASYCQLICDLYEQTSPEVTYYFLTEVLGKGDSVAKAFIDKLYEQFKRPLFRIVEGADLRSSLFSFCTDFREGNFATIFGNKQLSPDERTITREAIAHILNGMKDSFVPNNADIKSQFQLYNYWIKNRINNPRLKVNLSWQDRTMNLHQALVKLVDNPVENLDEFVTLTRNIKACNLNLNFQAVSDGLRNFDSVANMIPHQEIRENVQEVLLDLRTHQNQRNQQLIAPLAVAIAPAIPQGAAHLAAAAHAPDRNCTAILLFPFRFCYNAISTLVYNVAHALHIV